MDRIAAITLCAMLALVSVGFGRQNIIPNNSDTKVSWHLSELQEDQEKESIGNGESDVAVSSEPLLLTQITL